MTAAPPCAVLRCMNAASIPFSSGEGARVREWAVCPQHAELLEAGGWAFDGRALLLGSDMPPTIQRLTIHTAGESEFTVTIEHGQSSEDTESSTLQIPLWARRLLHTALSSRLEE